MLIKPQKKFWMPSPAVLYGAGAGVTLDAATTAWINAVNTAAGTPSVSATQQGYVDTLIKDLKTHGGFAAHDRIWLHASENTFQATIDIVNLQPATNHGASFTVTGGFSGGFAGNGSSTYVDSNFAGASGVKYQQDSASVTAYVRTNRTTAQNKAAVAFRDDVSTGRASRLFTYAPGAPNVVVASLNGNAGYPQFASPVATAWGCYTVARTTSTLVSTYRNSSSTAIGTDSTTSTAPVAVNFWIGAEHLSSGANTYWNDDEIAIVAFGSGMTNGTNVAQFQTDLNNYMHNIGKYVY